MILILFVRIVRLVLVNTEHFSELKSEHPALRTTHLCSVQRSINFRGGVQHWKFLVGWGFNVAHVPNNFTETPFPYVSSFSMAIHPNLDLKGDLKCP